MPGSPVIFSVNTVIIINAKSGKGKTTISNFLGQSNEKIHVLSSDKFFTKSNCELYSKKLSNTETEGIRNIFKKYEKPHLSIGRISNEMHLLHSRVFVNYVKISISKIFKKNKVKLIILEGETLKYENILEEIKNFLTIENIKWWIMS